MNTVMLRFENGGIAISVKLPRTDYTVHMMAAYDKDNKIYNTKTYQIQRISSMTWQII